jgi:hypothetical protein
MDYKRILNQYGYSFFGDCQCTGNYYEKFSSPNMEGYEIWVAPQAGFFRIFSPEKEPLMEDRAIHRLQATISLNNLY